MNEEQWDIFNELLTDFKKSGATVDEALTLAFDMVHTMDEE